MFSNASGHYLSGFTVSLFLLLRRLSARSVAPAVPARREVGTCETNSCELRSFLRQTGGTVTPVLYSRAL